MSEDTRASSASRGAAASRRKRQASPPSTSTGAAASSSSSPPSFAEPTARPPKRARSTRAAPLVKAPSEPSSRGASSLSRRRSLRDLDDHFPDVDAPENRRLTRSLARSLLTVAEGGETAPTVATDSTRDTASSAARKRSGGDRQPKKKRSSNNPDASQSTSSTQSSSVGTESTQESSSSSAGASSSSSSGGGGGRADAAGPSTSKRSKRVAALASKAGGRQRAVKTEDSSIDSPSDSPPRTVATGVCQSIGRSDNRNRVFPDAAAAAAADAAAVADATRQLQQQHQQQLDAQLGLQAMADFHAARQAAAAASGGGGLRSPGGFLGALVPRMQTLLTGGGGMATHQNQRVAAIMEGLRNSNEIRQSEAALELAELLLMGNEESLPQLSIKDVMRELMVLLQKEHNFELMLTAARCITNLLEALPRSVPMVLEAVPLLIEKLKRMECIDVAEQALTALEVLSRRHGKTVMLAGGIAATTSHLDFFNLQSQRVALQISANCAHFVTAVDFAAIRECIPDLTQRLTLEDKRSLESVCTVFSRVVDNLRSSPDRLKEVAAHGLLQNVRTLLHVQPPAIGAQCFQAIIRMLRQLCSRCTDLAVQLVEMDFVRTLRFLFVGNDDLNLADIELVNRPPQQLLELVLLAGELLPRLPSDGLFEIDAVFNRTPVTVESAAWSWKDEQGAWQPFCGYDARLLEMAFQMKEREVHLHGTGQPSTVDLEQMVQLDETTAAVRHVQRQVVGGAKAKAVKTEAAERDAREDMLASNAEHAAMLVRSLFPVLVGIDGSSSGPAIRFESLRTMLRIIFPTGADLLADVLGSVPLASHVASALSSSRSKDLCVVAAALQIVHLVTDKLPNVYGVLFRREGVVHQIERLAEMTAENSPCASPSSRSPADGAAASRMSTRTKGSSKAQAKESAGGRRRAASTFLHSLRIPTWGGGRGSTDAAPSSSSPTVQSSQLSGSKSSLSSGSSKSSARRAAAAAAAASASALSSNGASTSGPSSAATTPATATGLPRHVALQAQPVALAAGHAAAQHYISLAAAGGGARGLTTLGGMTLQAAAAMSTAQKDKLKLWIRKEAKLLMETYFAHPLDKSSLNEIQTLERLETVTANLTNSDTLRTSLTETLTEVRELITQADASAFELEFSGFIDALTHFLMSADLQPPQEERVRAFVSTLAAIDAEAVEAGDPSAFGQLVGKLQTSVAQREQFHVRASDLFDAGSGSLRGASAIRFFQTHQIRCTLRRHPECKELREWRHGHGSIRVDPFTQIGAIERYLLDRGLGQARAAAAAAAAGTGESSGDDSNDATSDDDELDDPEEAGGAEGGGRRRLELVIGDRVLPSHITVLQAIRQHSVAQQSHMLGGFEMESAALAASIWVNNHIIYYRVATGEAAAADATASPADGLSPPDGVDVLSVSSASSASAKKKSPKEKQPKVDEKLWNGGVVPERVSPLAEYLTAALPLDDPSNKSLALLRVLSGVNRYWWCLFSPKGDLPSPRSQLIGPAAFVNAKLSSKVGRQLQDVLSVATQQIPHWIYQLSFSYPFALSFGIRRNFLYCTAFGRDRAMMHLVNQSDSGGQSEGEAGRMTPRLERKKVSVRRDDLLKQAEDILGKMGTSRAMLEVGFESEVGTGIGPTLEFYSAVSRELQKHSLKLWHGDAVTAPAGHAGGAEVDYVAPEIGLFPNALPATTSARQRDARARKFEFIGRLMGQALIDGRMLDLPLNPIVYKWLLAKEQTADLADLALLDVDVHRAMLVMCAYSASDLEHMQQTFTMPGNDSFELYKNGGGELVTPKNVRQFAKLVAHWRLIEGVRREMEALRRGLETAVDVRHLRLFQPEEMEELFCGSADATSTDWDEPQLRQFIKPDHGYTHDSVQVKWLVQMMAQLGADDRRRLLQFATGSPRLPVGGFRALNPLLTVVRKSGPNVDQDLPSAMTCYNYLKVPAYSSYEVFEERFRVAMQHIYSFFLT